MEPYIKGRRFGGLWRLPVVLFGIAAWLVLICFENFYLIIDWLIVALYIHCELLKKYLFNIIKYILIEGVNTGVLSDFAASH